MMRRLSSVCLFALLIGASAGAQPRQIFDPSDSVDPRERDGTLFVTRLVIGGATQSADGYRPRDQDVWFVHVANSLYWRAFQFDYKHSEVRGQEPPGVTACGCSPTIYFPTAPSSDATPLPPPPSAKETTQLAWYWPLARGAGQIPVMLRSRVTWSWQPIDTEITALANGGTVARLSGNEQMFGLETDTYFRLGGHDVFGSLAYAVTDRSGTTDDRKQYELTYTNRFRAISFDQAGILVLPRLTVGGVTHRGGTAVNIVNPSFDASWHHRRSRLNLHVVWSPQATRDGSGWRTTQQLALFVDRALFVKLFH